MSLPTYELELKASDEREQLQESLRELKLHMHNLLRWKEAAREYVAPACGAAAVVATLAGYLFAALILRSG
ncbi:MAG TPA: hypothetical protein VLV49_16340 [Terriglobales bacterium]|nr:hypothetical protein [Terriglobales bacterium]